jgi:hypothetical protein
MSVTIIAVDRFLANDLGIDLCLHKVTALLKQAIP